MEALGSYQCGRGVPGLWTRVSGAFRTWSVGLLTSHIPSRLLHYAAACRRCIRCGVLFAPFGTSRCAGASLRQMDVVEPNLVAPLIIPQSGSGITSATPSDPHNTARPLEPPRSTRDHKEPKPPRFRSMANYSVPSTRHREDMDRTYPIIIPLGLCHEQLPSKLHTTRGDRSNMHFDMRRTLDP